MIWISGNVPSLKNSKVKTNKGIFASKTVKKYLQDKGVKSYSLRNKTFENYVKKRNVFELLLPVFKERTKHKEYPLKVGFHFVRKDNRSFDFHNAVQILADLMVAHNYIEDDDMDHFLPFPLEIKGKYYSVDKENPGVWIQIL